MFDGVYHQHVQLTYRQKAEMQGTRLPWEGLERAFRLRLDN